MDRPRAGLTSPRTPAFIEVRRAVRAWLDDYRQGPSVTVGLSGGADSLALTAATVAEADRLGLAVGALVVDHQLQDGSAAVAASAVRAALALGCARGEVLTVDVTGAGGREAAARRARYAALERGRRGDRVLLGHTLDDQAETVLLGLGRGSGSRSIWGMRPLDPPWGRPLLGIRRALTRRTCEELHLRPYEDPHNLDPSFTRVRMRTEVLPLLEEVLGGGVAQALARTASQLRSDGAALDQFATDGYRAAQLGDPDLDPTDLDPTDLGRRPAAIRRRVLRRWLLDNGATALTSGQLEEVDRLITHWHGQGGVAVGGGTPAARLVASRGRGRLSVGLQTTD